MPNSKYGVEATLDDKISGPLGKIQEKLKTTTAAFGGLKTALAGIAFGALIKDALAYADSIADLSEATDISIQKIVGFQKAVVGAGGSSEGAQKGVLKLINTIGEAAGGSLEAQDAFARVGVTLNDLATLSNADILRKTVAGLANITDKGEQSILKTALLGKEFRGVTAAKLDESLDKATAASAKYAESIKKAADAQDAFDRAVSASKMAIIDLISPLTSLAGALGESRFDFFITGMVKLSAAVGAFFAVLKLASIFGTLIAGLTGVAATFGYIGAAVVISTTAILGWFALAGGAAAVLSAIFDVDIVEKFKNGIGFLVDKIKEYYAIITGGPKFLDESEVARENKLLEQRQNALTKQQEEMRKVADATKKLRLEMQGVTEEFHKQNIAMVNQIGFENELIGTTLEYQEARKAEKEIIKRSQDAIEKLTAAKEKLSEAEKRSGMGAVIDGQIAKIQKLAAADIELAKNQQKNLQETTMKQKLLEFGTKNRIDFEDKLMSIQKQMAQGTMSEIERKYDDIARAADEAALSAIRAEEARLGRRLTTDEAAKYYKEAAKWTEILTEEEQRAYDESRKFSTGWQKAFKEYADNATNAASVAERIFTKAMSSMEDAIVNFAKTGKFEFKNFVAGMLEELMRSQLKQTMASLFQLGGGGGGGSGAGIIGSLLGFANGGMIPTNQPVLVGEKGPEIISGAGGRTVIPNNAIAGGTAVTYNISAVDAMSFKQMIAQDPSFLYAVTQQGAKGTPGRR